MKNGLIIFGLMSFFATGSAMEGLSSENLYSDVFFRTVANSFEKKLFKLRQNAQRNEYVFFCVKNQKIVILRAMVIEITQSGDKSIKCYALKSDAYEEGLAPKGHWFFDVCMKDELILRLLRSSRASGLPALTNQTHDGQCFFYEKCDIFEDCTNSFCNEINGIKTVIEGGPIALAPESKITIIYQEYIAIQERFCEAIITQILTEDLILDVPAGQCLVFREDLLYGGGMLKGVKGALLLIENMGTSEEKISLYLNSSAIAAILPQSINISSAVFESKPSIPKTYADISILVSDKIANLKEKLTSLRKKK